MWRIVLLSLSLARLSLSLPTPRPDSAMGCNQSTANDVTESRQRVPVDTHASSPPSGPVGLDKAPSRAIATYASRPRSLAPVRHTAHTPCNSNINTRPGPRPDEAKLSQSASNRAENANDTFFKALIERTAKYARHTHLSWLSWLSWLSVRD